MSVSIRPRSDVPDGTPMAVSLKSTAELVTGTWRTFRPLYVTRPSPCNQDCPAGTDVRGFLARAAAGDAEGAWRTILEHNPLPGICGRVCYHPCESGCNRVDLDARVAVHAVERAIADEVRRLAGPETLREAWNVAAGKRIAVIGSGPAGLSCAYHLARRGHAATVFEAAEQPGGMLRYGIPSYRLPREVLDGEIDRLRQMGVEFKTRTRLGQNLSWTDLRPFDAVFLAVGIQRSKAVGIPGVDLEGVRPALAFLRSVNAGKATRVSGTVVVIGGGNTALDAARVALRQGSDVTVVYRRTREEMPAHPDEIAQAQSEGVKFVFQATPLRFDGSRGILTGLEIQRTRPGAPDASGRRAPEPIPGAVEVIPCNHALTAIGEELDTQAFDSIVEIARGRLVADSTGQTAQRPFFAGGDAATGAGTVVDAIGSGRRAAEAIDAWLEGKPIPVEPERGDRVGPDDLNLFYFGQAPRTPSPALDPARSIAGFDEVVGSLTWNEAILEAGRCLTCGSCTECGNCLTFCPDAAVRKTPGGYAIDYLHCKGCGICVEECPRGAMTLVPEEAR